MHSSAIHIGFDSLRIDESNLRRYKPLVRLFSHLWTKMKERFFERPLLRLFYGIETHCSALYADLKSDAVQISPEELKEKRNALDSLIHSFDSMSHALDEVYADSNNPILQRKDAAARKLYKLDALLRKMAYSDKKDISESEIVTLKSLGVNSRHVVGSLLSK